MSTQRDYYEILGVQKGADEATIKKAYRALVMKYHPDRVPEAEKKQAEEKFKEISESYAVLSDAKKRQLYDQYGHAGIDSRFSTEDIFRGANFGDFSDIFGGGSIFEELFGGGGLGSIFGGGGTTTRRMRRGQDVNHEIEIPLEEAAVGCSKSLKFTRFENCKKCRGSGAEPGSRKITCSTCHGKGQVISGMGFINIAQTCPTCHGEGVSIGVKCSNCRGQGKVRVSKSLKINIPAGVDSGSVLRLKDEGHHGAGGYGSLYLHIGVAKHRIFERNGSNLKCRIKISMVKAVLGAEVEIPTLMGKAKMKIPAGTQVHSIFRLKNKGVIDFRTKCLGDQLVEVDIDIPKKISGKERKLLEEFGRLRKEI